MKSILKKIITENPDDLLQCSFCGTAHDKSKFMTGIVDHMGEAINVNWCMASWEAYYKIQSLKINASNSKKELNS